LTHVTEIVEYFTTHDRTFKSELANDPQHTTDLPHSNTSCNEEMAFHTMCTAAAAGRAEELLQLLEGGETNWAGTSLLNETNWAGTSLLHFAATGQSSTVQMLLGRGAHVNPQTLEGYTPLHDAAYGGHTAIVEMLLGRDADFTLKTRQGKTALHSSAEAGHNAIVSMILAKGADVHVKSKDGATPLHDAAHDGRESTVQLLLVHGAGVNMKSNTGATPLFHASEEGHVAVVQTLLDQGADVHAKTKRLRKTPLHRASEEGHFAVVNTLLDRGADLLAMTRSGETPEVLASARGHEEVATMLRAVATRRAKCEAFAMSQHKRLGTGSRLVRDFDPGLVRMILDQV
jgi:ankyrin repeat protein